MSAVWGLLMFTDYDHAIPTVLLLLNRIRRVGVPEARRVVAAELGDEAEGTVNEWPVGSTTRCYLEWRAGVTPYHLGTCSEPYVPVIGDGKADSAKTPVGTMEWTVSEEAPPEPEELCNAWMAHTAWLYVDALVFESRAHEGGRHFGNVLRVCSHFIDERCVLVWLYSGEPKRVALPTPRTVKSLQAGVWPP